MKCAPHNVDACSICACDEAQLRWVQARIRAGHTPRCSKLDCDRTCRPR